MPVKLMETGRHEIESYFLGPFTSIRKNSPTTL